MSDEATAAAVRRWVDTIIVGLGLCPFARRELVADRIRFAVTPAATEDELLCALQEELERLEHDDSIATTLLIHPHALESFADYNQFLDLADALIAALDLDGVFQVASFHPAYQYAGTRPEDPENCINRSPFPLLHLLREEGITAAVDSFPDVESIPARNIACMNELGALKYKELLAACFRD